jgi:MauM/NapG family ferredoxin protein
MKADKDPRKSLSVDRRGFFRELLSLGLDEAQKVGQLVANQFEQALAVPQKVRYVRPPGAIIEEDYANTCSRCGDCVAACPAQCIVLDPDVAGGLPHILPRQSACVVCDDLACMKACPSGALQNLPIATLIHMGTAQVDFDRCVRSHDPDGCNICIEHCPIGDTALGLDDVGRVEVRGGCIGCGICEQDCPTDPASIVILPRDHSA